MDNSQVEQMKRGTPHHPKTFELADALGIQRYSAVGILELLWHFTAEFAPRGDVGRFSDKRIEAALDWDGEPGALIAALVKTKWLDECKSEPHRLVVHDWHEHADQAVERKLDRAGVSFLSIAAEVASQRLEKNSFARNKAMASCNKQQETSSPSGFDFEAWTEKLHERWGDLAEWQIGLQKLSEIVAHPKFDREKFEMNFNSWCDYYDKTGWNYGRKKFYDWLVTRSYARKAPPIPKKTTAQNEMYGGTE